MNTVRSMMEKDRLYEYPLEKVGDFKFDEHVVAVFPDMISRSVPGYGSVLAMTVQLAEQFSQPESNLYDLGCSLGAVTIPMATSVVPSARLTAVDSSHAMIESLRSKLDSISTPMCPVQLVESDLLDVELQDASFVVLNYTLQFIARNQRQQLIERIYTALRPGGALVLSEKISFESDAEQELMTELHHAFKRAHGYSDLEIAQKRSALERIMIPETLVQHRDRLAMAGFEMVSVWFQCLNFASIIAIKSMS